jgi:hypothetical protein
LEKYCLAWVKLRLDGARSESWEQNGGTEVPALMGGGHGQRTWLEGLRADWAKKGLPGLSG